MLHTGQAVLLAASVYWLAIKTRVIVTLSRTRCSDTEMEQVTLTLLEVSGLPVAGPDGVDCELSC